MDSNHPINDLMATTMQKIREMIDTNTIVGEPIITPDGVTLIPVSKLSFGFATGGSDFTSKGQDANRPNPFGGGGGAGVKVDPVAFLVVKEGSVKLLPVSPLPGSSVDRVIELVPEVVDKVTNFIDRQQEKSTRGDFEG